MDLQLSENRVNADLNNLQVAYSCKTALKWDLLNMEITEILVKYFNAYSPVLEYLEDDTYRTILKYLVNTCRETNKDLFLQIIGEYRQSGRYIFPGLENIFKL